MATGADTIQKVQLVMGVCLVIVAFTCYFFTASYPRCVLRPFYSVLYSNTGFWSMYTRPL